MPDDAATLTRPPMLRLTAGMVGLCVLASAIGAWAATARDASWGDGVLSLGATLPGVIVSLLLLSTRPAQPAVKWAAPTLAGSMVRALLTLSIAVGMLLTLSPDRTVFLLTTLGALLACLAFEVGTVLLMVNARGEPSPASLEGVRS